MAICRGNGKACHGYLDPRSCAGARRVRRAHRHRHQRQAGPAGRGAALQTVLAGRASQHGGHRQCRDRRADRACGRPHRDDPRGRGRHHAAQPRAPGRGRGVRDAGHDPRPAHRPGAGPRARRRRRGHARPAPGHGAQRRFPRRRGRVAQLSGPAARGCPGRGPSGRGHERAGLDPGVVALRRQPGCGAGSALFLRIPLCAGRTGPGRRAVSPAISTPDPGPTRRASCWPST